jgi:hypothetical protein
VDPRPGYADKAFMLIKWVDSWKKLFILVVLTAFGIFSLLIYQNRVELSTLLFSHFSRIQIDNRQIDGEAIKLLADTGGVSVAVWSINFTINQRTALYVRIKDQRMNNQEGLSDLALRKSSQLTADIIELIDNKAFCWRHVANTDVGRSARESGVTYVCAAAIPPRFGVMVGMLAVGFESPPANEDFVKFRLKQAAVKMIR